MKPQTAIKLANLPEMQTILRQLRQWDDLSKHYHDGKTVPSASRDSSFLMMINRVWLSIHSSNSRNNVSTDIGINNYIKASTHYKLSVILTEAHSYEVFLKKIEPVMPQHYIKYPTKLIHLGSLDWKLGFTITSSGGKQTRPPQQEEAGTATVAPEKMDHEAIAKTEHFRTILVALESGQALERKYYPEGRPAEELMVEEAFRDKAFKKILLKVVRGVILSTSMDGSCKVPRTTQEFIACLKDSIHHRFAQVLSVAKTEPDFREWVSTVIPNYKPYPQKLFNLCKLRWVSPHFPVPSYANGNAHANTGTVTIAPAATPGPATAATQEPKKQPRPKRKYTRRKTRPGTKGELNKLIRRSRKSGDKTPETPAAGDKAPQAPAPDDTTRKLETMTKDLAQAKDEIRKLRSVVRLIIRKSATWTTSLTSDEIVSIAEIVKE